MDPKKDKIMAFLGAAYRHFITLEYHQILELRLVFATEIVFVSRLSNKVSGNCRF